MIYLRNVHPRKTVLVPLGAGWARMLRPAVTAELPERVLHTEPVRALLLHRLVEIASGEACDADARQRRASRTDWARAIAVAERHAFDKLRADPTPQHYWTAPQLERLRERIAAGATMRQLATEHGMTRQAMSNLCQRHGLRRRS